MKRTIWLAVILNVLFSLSIVSYFSAAPVQFKHSGDPEATITISSSELKNLRATHIDLLPAPGTDKYYEVFFTDAEYQFGTTAYTNISADTLDVAEGDNGMFQLNDNEIINAPDSRIYQKSGGSVAGPAILANVTNQPLVLENLSPAELAGGDGHLTIRLHYEIKTVAP